MLRKILWSLLHYEDLTIQITRYGKLCKFCSHYPFGLGNFHWCDKREKAVYKTTKGRDYCFNKISNFEWILRAQITKKIRRGYKPHPRPPLTEEQKNHKIIVNREWHILNKDRVKQTSHDWYIKNREHHTILIKLRLKTLTPEQHAHRLAVKRAYFYKHHERELFDRRVYKAKKRTTIAQLFPTLDLLVALTQQEPATYLVASQTTSM